jgi:hypothetical protein
MCTRAEAATHGHEAGAGAGRKKAATSATRPEPTAMFTVSSSLSSPALTSTFQLACRSAAPSTAAVTPAEISTR